MTDNTLISFIPANIQEASKDMIEAQGKEALVIAMEEACEFSQAVSKMYRKKDFYENLCEETADALIAISIAIHNGKLKEEDIQYWIDFKINRFYTRRENGEL